MASVGSAVAASAAASSAASALLRGRFGRRVPGRSVRRVPGRAVAGPERGRDRARAAPPLREAALGCDGIRLASFGLVAGQPVGIAADHRQARAPRTVGRLENGRCERRCEPEGEPEVERRLLERAGHEGRATRLELERRLGQRRRRRLDEALVVPQPDRDRHGGRRWASPFRRRSLVARADRLVGAEDPLGLAVEQRRRGGRRLGRVRRPDARARHPGEDLVDPAGRVRLRAVGQAARLVRTPERRRGLGGDDEGQRMAGILAQRHGRGLAAHRAGRRSASEPRRGRRGPACRAGPSRPSSRARPGRATAGRGAGASGPGSARPS